VPLADSSREHALREQVLPQSHGAQLLAPADEFCCDVFETENKKDSSRFYGEE